MGKTRKFKKIEDFAAGIITLHDEKQAKFDIWLVRAVATFMNAAAALIYLHDNLQARWDRLWMIIKYKLENKLYDLREAAQGQGRKILGHFTVILLTTIALVSVMSYSTGFEYYYNGRSLGYVKDQNQVTKILDLVSEQLSREHGYRINISEESDIEFKPIFILDKELDDIDTVLNRFTYMSDTRAEGYTIYVDGRATVTCKDMTTAESVLQAVTDEYTKEKDNVIYKEVGFEEDVEIRKTNVRLKNISSYSEARKRILTGGSKEITYKIKKGDSIYGICEEYSITVDELKKNNPKLDIDMIHEGEELIITKASAAVSVRTVSQEKYAEKIEYKTKVVKNNSMYKGNSKVIQEGKNGKRVVTAKVIRVNGDKVSKTEISSKTITKPVTKIIEKGTKEPPKTAATGSLTNPVPGFSVTSYFGYRWGRLHEGVDLAGPVGTTVRSADGGRVVSAGWYGAYGICVEIDHENGMTTRYAHCNDTLVSAGERVYKGQAIALSGNTGRSTGPHLHFEVRVNGSVVDPFNYI